MLIEQWQWSEDRTSRWGRRSGASLRISGRASGPATSTADRCSASTPSPRRRTRTPCDGVSPRKTEVFRTPLNFIARSSARMDRITSGPPSAIRSTRPGGTSIGCYRLLSRYEGSHEILYPDTPKGPENGFLRPPRCRPCVRDEKRGSRSTRDDPYEC